MFDRAYLWVALFVLNVGAPTGLVAYELWRSFAKRGSESGEVVSSQSETQQQADGVPTDKDTTPTEQSATASPRKDQGKRGADNTDAFENPLAVG